ncbi:hypothetical protein NE237_033284 [Protea cynaroides]|uniref:F-box associated beta-propeller type 1 domain-containing protein n=1 Tax=Protea cynaroides TaxID=273540 RepID=A0A9Q0L4T3_9MAGN|nr:hypothetical protein NE237_033284 [Protea cynaroides]
MVNGEGDWKTREIPLNFDLKGRYSEESRSFLIVGSYNGILCITAGVGRHPMYLLNPITGEKMKLPKSNHRLPPKLNLAPSYGFGWDSLSNNYKVVRLHYEVDVNSSKIIKGFCEVITVGEDHWRRLDFPTITDSYGSDSNPVLLDGTLYWLSDHPWCPPDQAHILAFDIDSENFWTMDCCPPCRICCERDLVHRRSLIIMDGSLAIIDHQSDYCCPRFMDIWLVNGSKTMGFSLSLTTYDMSGLLPYLRNQYGCGQFFVIAKVGHDKFLLHLRTEKQIYKGLQCSIFLYSPERKLYSAIHGSWSTEYVLEYCWMVPTLKSLKAMIDG